MNVVSVTLDINSIKTKEERNGAVTRRQSLLRILCFALRADERRDKLRKAAGSGKYTLIRRYLNGGTHIRKPYVPFTEQA